MAVQADGAGVMGRSSTYVKAAIVSALVGWLAIDVYMSGVYQVHGISPLRLFQWDASNLLGKDAYAGGFGSAGIGLFLDFLVSLAWGAACVFAFSRSAAARSHPVWFGTAFGAVVMTVMLWVLVPLGRATHGGMTLSSFFTVLVGHTLFFGIPLALTARAVGKFQAAQSERSSER